VIAMISQQTLVRSLAGLAVIFVLSRAQADERPQKSFAQVKRAFYTQLRSSQVRTRVDAARRLADYQSVDAAKLIAMYALKDDDPSVRMAGLATLLSYRENEEICTELVNLLKRELQGSDPRAAKSLLAALIASSLPRIEEKLFGVFEKGDTVSKLAMNLSLEMARDFQRLELDAALPMLKRFARSYLFRNRLAFRRAVVRASASFRGPEAIAWQIELLDIARGEVRRYLVEHLAEISLGAEFDTDAAAWARWWNEKKADFEYPTDEEILLQRALGRSRGGPRYYGIPIYAQRLVFVVDTSKSMAGSRLTTVKREMEKAIRSLPADTQFTIIEFGTRVSAWKKELVAASDEIKEEAVEYVRRLRPVGTTNTHEALMTALNFEVEAVYFLSDGEPSAGRVVRPAAILKAITIRNQLRHLSIYTIGVMPGPPGSILDTFLRKLAENNFGVYQRVDN
jgi:hypothetical protein